MLQNVALIKKTPKGVFWLGILLSRLLADIYTYMGMSSYMSSVMQSLGTSGINISSGMTVASVLLTVVFEALFAILAVKVIFAVALRVCYSSSFRICKSRYVFPILKPDFEKSFMTYIIIANLVCSLFNLGYAFAPYAYYLFTILSYVVRIAIMVLGYFDMRKAFVPNYMTAVTFFSIFVIYIPISFLGVI